MKPPRILFVYQFLSLGGVEVVMQTRLRELTRRNIKARMLFLESWGGESIFKKMGDQIAVVSEEAEIEKYLRDFNPDWISAIDTPGIIPIACRIVPNARIAYEVHSSYPDYYALLLDRDLLNSVSGIIVPSQSQKEFMALRLARPLPIGVVANSIPEEFFQQTTLPGPSKRPIVMWVGRLDSVKNWRGFIELAAQVRERTDAEFWLVGGLRDQEEVNLFEALKQARLMDSFRWLPAVNYEDMPGLYSFVGHSGGCLVSTSWAESFGMAALEAMASRCPVVAPDIVGLRDLVKHGQTGWLYPPMNLHLACDFILESMQNLSGRQIIIENAERMARRFTPTAIVDQLLEVFSEWPTKVSPKAETLSFEHKSLMDQLRVKAEWQAAQVAEKGLRVGSLTQQLIELNIEKEQAVRTLTVQLAEREQILLLHSARMREQEQEIQTLSSQVAEAEQNARDLSLQLATKEREAQGLSGQLSARDYELRKITSTLGWRLLSRYGRIKYKYLLPIYKALGLPPYNRKTSNTIQTNRLPFHHLPDKGEATPALTAESARQDQLCEPIESNTFEIVCFPIIDWDFRFQRPQQLMSRFASAGHRVFYLSQEFRASGEPYVIVEKSHNVYEVSLCGQPRNVYTGCLNDRSRDELFNSIDALRRDLSLGATVAFAQLPFWWPLVDKTRTEFAWPIVYDCMDHHAGFSTNRPTMIDQERCLLASSDLVVVSSSFLKHEAERHNSTVLLVRNACEYEHFAKASARKGERPVIGYHGAIADWFDSDLVADLAERRPDWDFVLVGSTFSADTRRLSKLANVALPGEKHYSAIPDWLGNFDVAIIPFKRIPLTEATNPVKAYEILAAGKPLVSVPIPEVAALSPLVRLASTAEEFEKEIATALAEDGPESIAKRRAFAKAHTWEKRYEILAPAVHDAFPKASIIVVTFNNLELNRLCLESIYARTEWPNFEVIVIDNASADGTPDFLKDAEKIFPNLRVVLNHSNLGFAAANNIGLRFATGDYVVLLNNDTVVSRGWISALIRHLHTDQKIGMIGPVTNAISNEAKIEVGYTRLEEMPGWAANYVREHDGQLSSISMLAMFCVAMRREVFKKVGYLDERFGVGMFEDDDYCRRVRDLGYELRLARDSFVHHWQRASFRLIGEEEYLKIYLENRNKYESKWKGSQSVAGTKRNLYREQQIEVLAKIEDSKGVVIFLPSIGWNIHLFQRPHHLAQTFARNGYVSIFDSSNAQDDVEGFKEIEPNLFLFHGPEDALHEISDPILWAFPYNFDCTDAYPRSARTVYDWIDALEVFPYSRAFLERNHKRGLREATLVAAVTRQLHVQAQAVRPDSIYLPNAVEYERFANDAVQVPYDAVLADFLRQGKPIAGYYGALAEWFDYPLLDEVARRRQDWNFLLIGQMLDRSLSRAAILNRGNVKWIGPRQYASLPGYLRAFDVAMIPFVINNITLTTSPLKLYEYFAGGKAVITTAMPECEIFSELVIVRSAEEFSQALDQARELGRDDEYQARVRALARLNSWTIRVQTVEGVLRLRKEANDKATQLPAAVTAEPVVHRMPQALKRQKLVGAAADIAESFQHFRTTSNRGFFDALCNHFSGSVSDPCLPMYFQFAITCNERGRRVASYLNKYTDLRGKQYLDVGCAYAGFLVAFAEQDARVIGIDTDEILLKLAQHNLLDSNAEAPLLKRDATRSQDLVEFRDSFDIITCNDVIEHVDDPQSLLRNIADLLRDDGIAYFEIPNRYHPRHVLQDGHYNLFGITLLDYSDASEYYSHHAPGVPYAVRHYLGIDEYSKLFEQAGMTLKVIDESFEGLNIQAALDDLAELRHCAKTSLAKVPPSVRHRVEERLSCYLTEVGDSTLATASKHDFVLRYGLGFWRVVARKVSDKHKHLPKNLQQKDASNSLIVE